MPTSSYSIEIRYAAERIAAAWLLSHEYCDCAIQQQAIARRLLPVLAMFERELQRNTRLDRDEVDRRMCLYMMRAHDTLTTGLHRPGRSALPADLGRRQRDDGAAN